MQMGDADVQWEELPAVAAVQVLSYLEACQLVRAGCVCKNWYSLSCSNALWKSLCWRDWGTILPPLHDLNSSCSPSFDGMADHKDLYERLELDYGPYKNHYAMVKRMWEDCENWLRANAPLITLKEGATENDIKMLEKVLDTTLPMTLKCSLRIKNGQESEGNYFHGLLGGYSFYDHHTNMRLCSTTEMARLFKAIKTKSNALPSWLAHACPVARSNIQGKICFVLLNDIPGHGNAGNIVTHSVNYEHTFVLADDYVSWLADHINKLRSGAYSVTESDEINVFPKAGMRGVGLAETRGIVIESSPLFIPEKCNLSLTPPSYFWAYRIQMAMDPSCTQPASKLKERHWLIKDATGHVEEVRGPGVIGMYPVMQPGALFEYESCCPLHTATGSMRGSFTMVCLDVPHSKFDAEVAEMEFFVPPPITSQQQQQHIQTTTTTNNEAFK